MLYTNSSQVGSIDAIATQTTKALGLGTHISDVHIPNADPARQLELYGHGYSIFIMNAADQQCNFPDGNRHMTFDEGIYDVNIARTNFLPGRSWLKQIIMALEVSANQHMAVLSDRAPKCDENR